MIKSDGRSESIEKIAIELTIRIGILAVLVAWTFLIIKPFLIPVLWGIIIAVALEPFMAKLSAAAGGRRKLVSVILALLVIGALIIPAFLLVSSSFDTAVAINAAMENNTLRVPPPPESVQGWPFVGQQVHSIWYKASINLEAILHQYSPQLKSLLTSMAFSFGSGLASVFMFIISIIIASALLATPEIWAKATVKTAGRFVGSRGVEIIDLATATIRGVMQGVVGVAVIQAILSAVGMLLVGVPATGLWAGLVLICAVIQLPPIIILGPVAAWVFSAAENTPAVLFLIWAILVSASDGVLKPLLMGRGVDIPMLVILIGALGGMMLSGIIGLFVGAVIVAISYTLFVAWINEEKGSEFTETEKEIR